MVVKHEHHEDYLATVQMSQISLADRSSSQPDRIAAVKKAGWSMITHHKIEGELSRTAVELVCS